jgi:ribosomal protein S18 acetylase RimI-like enzyme
MNVTFKDIYAYASLSEKEMNEFANRYLMILDPRFLKVIEKKDKEVVAFILAMPDISEGLKKCKGRLLPFGIFQVFRAQKKTNQLNLLLGAIRPDYRNAGIDTMMGVKILEDAKNAGIEYIDSHLQMETNIKMHGEMARMGGQVYKRFRIFKRAL